jgi:hypothetical protein
MATSETGLRIRALAAASAARYAGFTETSQALLELARQCDRVQETTGLLECGKDVLGRWIAEIPSHASIQ